MKTIRKWMKLGNSVTLLLIGGIFIVLAAIAIFTRPKNLISAEGVITNIESFEDPSGETQNQVFVSFTDPSGTSHENIPYPAYDSGMKVGESVEVLCRTDTCEEIEAASGKILPFVFLLIGCAAAAVSIRQIVNRKKAPSFSPFEASPSSEAPAPLVNEQSKDGTMEDYYFHWTGKMNQSYILETPSREPVYEAICEHIGIFKPSRYTFVNRKTGESKRHEISHTATTRYGNNGFSLVDASDFKIDGMNNWEYFHNLGLELVPQRNGIKLNFEVTRSNAPIAFLEAAGTNILKDDAKAPLGDMLPGPGLYRVSCKEHDIEGVFYACFCASRVEFY